MSRFYGALTAAQFIEYAKKAKGEEVIPLIESTIKETTGKSARDTADIIRDTLNACREERADRTKANSDADKPTNWKNKFQKLYEAAKDKESFINAMQGYIEQVKSAEQVTA